MSQFKKFNSSDNINNYSSNYRGREGELTWDPSNGLRLHDGNTDGGNPIGGSGFSGNYSDLSNRPNGNTAVHDLIGSGTSLNTGKFLQQTGNGTSDWMDVPTVYETLTADIFTANTKINGGLVNPVGEKVTGLTSTLGYGAPYQLALTGPNQAFTDFFNRGSSIVGWKIYPENDPSSFVTITDYLGNTLGAPSLGFDNNFLTGTGPWTAESPDYSLGTPGPLTLAANTAEWVFGTDGVLTLPAGGDIVDSNGVSVLGGGSGVNEGADIRDYGAEANAGSGNITIDNSNYKRHWLLNINGNPGAGLVYVLGNGNEGDVIYFMPGSQFNPSQNLLQVSNYEYYNGTNNRFEFRNGTVQLFSTTDGNTESIVRATWSYNAWHFSGPVTTVS